MNALSCTSVDVCSYAVWMPPYYQYLQVDPQILPWAFSVSFLDCLCLWLLASCWELSECCSWWSGAGRGMKELPDAALGWTWLVYHPVAKLSHYTAAQAKTAFASLYFHRKARKHVPERHKHMQICKELKAGFTTATSHTHIGQVETFYKETLAFFIPHVLFSGVVRLKASFSQCISLVGMVVLEWWCWLLHNNIWFSSSRNVWHFSSVRSFPAPGFPSPEGTALKGDVFSVIFISQVVMH